MWSEVPGDLVEQMVWIQDVFDDLAAEDGVKLVPIEGKRALVEIVEDGPNPRALAASARFSETSTP